MTQENAITKKQTTALSTDLHTDWGTEDFDASDVLVKKLIITQSNSKAAMSQAAKAGDIVEFPGLNVIGGTDKGVSFIPFKMFKTWNIFEDGQTWVRQDDYTPANASEPIEYTEDGKSYTRVKTLNFFALLVEGGEFLPVVIPFSKSSYRVGQELINHQANMKRFNQPFAKYVWTMKTKMVTYNNNNWFAPILEKGEASTEEQLGQALEWWKTLTPADAAKVEYSQDLEDTVDTTTKKF